MKRILIGLLFLIPIMVFAMGMATPINGFSTQNDLRTYRVSESVSDNWDGTSAWAPSEKSQFCYPASYPLAADSIIGYVYSDNMWTQQSSAVLTYDPNHEYITMGQMDMVLMGIMRIPFLRETLTYNSDHHLRAVVIAMRDYQSGIWSDAAHLTLTYNGQSVANVVSWNAGDDTDPAYFEKMIFDYDTQGRIVMEHHQESVDSVNWVSTTQTTRIYHPNDTSTGASFIDYLSHAYGMMAFIGEDISWGMVSEETEQEWQIDAWVNSGHRAYTYDANNHLLTATDTYWDGTQWLNSEQQDYTYDANGNRTMWIRTNWNGTNWSNNERKTYTWNPTTGNDDSTIPQVADFAISAYPNPFRGNLNVQVNSKSQAPVSVKIFNMKGQLVHQETAQANATLTISDKALGSGIYFLKASQGNETVTRKIIQMK